MGYKSETKIHSTGSVSSICQNCKQDFTIDPEDFGFYEKIKVPLPTWCPECRLLRRMVWRNMRSLHKRECGLCNTNLISVYPDDGCPVFCSECFNGDAWDRHKYQRDVDFSRDFFSQIRELFLLQPRVFQFRIGSVINCDYGNAIANSKNCYLCFSALDDEDIMYSENIDRSRNTLDSFSVADLEQCYWNIFSTKNYNSHYMLSSSSCIDSYFLYDCMNCQNCCLSSNLRNQQYIFNNKKLSKEEYQKAVKDLNINTYSGFKKAEGQFHDLYKNAIHKYAQIISSQNVTGDLILNSKNIINSFDINNSSEDIKYGSRIIKGKQLFDCSYSFAGEFLYECMATSHNTFNQIFSMYCDGSKNMVYSIFCKNSSDCFGCVGLKNAQYCILNKRYSKEEYFKNIENIKKHMNDVPYVDKLGRIYKYGEFFPFEFSPFGYNESVALDVLPMSKESATLFGLNWKEKEKKNYSGLVDSNSLPDNIDDVSDAFLDSVISCPSQGDQAFQCTSAFKITLNELRFYREKKLPLPRYCHNCRHYQRLKYRNPMKLVSSHCNCDLVNHSHSGVCGNVFKTTFPDKISGKVYCERCYQQEVY